MNPLSWLKEVLRGRQKSDSERRAIVDGALALERRFLSNQITENEYEQEHRQIRLRLAAIDLSKSLSDSLQNINAIAREKAELLLHDGEKAKVVLRQSYMLEEAALEKNKKFRSGKIPLEEYVKFLKEKQSDALDLEHSLKLAVRRLESRRIAEISDELRGALDKKHAEKKDREKMFDEVYLEARSSHRNASYIQRYRPQKKTEKENEKP